MPSISSLQRWYLARAETGLEGLPPPARAQALAIDRFLASRRAVAAWLALAACALATAAGFAAIGLPAWAAALCSAAFYAGLVKLCRRAWLRPEQFSARRLWQIAVCMLVGTYSGAIASIIGVHRDRSRTWDTDAVLQVLWRATPVQLAVALGVLVLLWIVASARRVQSQGELARLQLVHERDAAARQASEAQLRLLRAQIQPHFIFNTLAAVQHWVDVGDARASGLLRELTAFLRGATELLGRPAITLGDEAELLLHHYLSIMQARIGERLRFGLEIDPRALPHPLPPGLLVTLAENAVEHGIAPSLHGGEVEVHAHTDEAGFLLRVRNTGVPLQPGWRDGVGLANCRERLQHQFGARARLELRSEDGATIAEVRIAPEAAA